MVFDGSVELGGSAGGSTGGGMRVWGGFVYDCSLRMSIIVVVGEL